MRKFAIESLISLDAALDSRDDSKAISRCSYCVCVSNLSKNSTPTFQKSYWKITFINDLRLGSTKNWNNGTNLGTNETK